MITKITRSFLLVLLAGYSISTFASVQCPPMPDAVTNVNRDFKSYVDANVGSLWKIRAVEIAVQTEILSKNLFEKFPNVDKIVAMQTMAATYCGFLNQSNLSDTDKLGRWEKFQDKVLNIQNHLVSQDAGNFRDKKSASVTKSTQSSKSSRPSENDNLKHLSIDRANNESLDPSSSSVAENALLRPQQERFLLLLYRYQVELGVRKLIVGRSDGAVFLVDQTPRPTRFNFMQDMSLSPDKGDRALFEQLVEEMPQSYVRSFTESRFDNPFVIGITEEGQRYVQRRSQDSDNNTKK